ncbi:Cytochrome P450 [Glarea lozoyensis ATCC 20868]|uniref:Cytochrome P450 n=1 Tax=Glarea lozoyensis (strain ATCC 20868 / MF5171) TaxID=1116229 RepID=S3D4S0_GLAL2|nr:Cytochrome P450 [Glarea lozoyensis ATCC 20868]EPE33442.1 Cytochrome P450 [Glarea lozoyensis ATCC 20868]
MFFAFSEYTLPFLIGLCALEISWIIYCRYFHPLRSVPGPFLASISRSWIVFNTASGRMEHTQRRLHKKYGQLVRIAPNEIACSDPAAIKTIYSTKSVFNKSDFYDAWAPPNNGYVGHFPSRNEKEHSERRRIVNNVYSMSSVLESEKAIDWCTQLFCDTFNVLARQNKAIDLGLWINMYTFDVLGELFYGKMFGFMSERTDIGGYMKAIDSLLPAFTIGGTVPSYLTKMYLLSTILISPSIRGALGAVKKIEDASKAAVEKRKVELATAADDKHDMIRKMLDINTEKGEKIDFTHEHIYVESHSSIFAGADTTAIAINSVLYHLMKNPKAYKKLTAEIDEAVTNSTLHIPVSYAAAIKLPYLKACVNEGMRMHPSVGLTMPRVVPAGGTIICDTDIPAGYRVGINPAVVHYDKEVFGSDADEFNPDRWIIGDAVKMEKTILQFGAGSRTCIGKNISLSEIYKLIPQILRLFTIRLEDPSKDWETHNYSAPSLPPPLQKVSDWGYHAPLYEDPNDTPTSGAPPANTEGLFELEAYPKGLFELQTSSPGKKESSSDIKGVPDIYPVTKTFNPDPFVVPFSLFSHGPNIYPTGLDTPPLETWDVQIPPDTCPPRLCDICRLVNTRQDKLDIEHHNLEGLKIAIAEGCRLCRFIFEHALKHNHVSTVKQWYSNHLPTLAIRTERSSSTFLLWPYLSVSFELCRSADYESEEEDPIRFQDISADPSGDSSINLIKGWINECESSHPRCRNVSGRLPTRLINVTSPEPFIVSLSPASTDAIEYAALSHCWGQKPTITTKKSNFESHCDMIPMSTLPKSFSDAVMVTRKLGIPFLWIDSLCIIQDSEEDWQRESAMMGDIYRNSHLTLSALDASDSHCGFICSRSRDSLVHLSGNDSSQELYVRPASKPWDTLFSDAPLNKRAWALQERLLSTRVVHFSKTELLWECYFKRVLPSIHYDLESFKGSHTAWYRVVQSYSGRSLTRQSDKLPAIAGIAASIASVTGFDYRHGLWAEDFKAGLLWRIDPSSLSSNLDLNTEPTLDLHTPTVPSWSWTSINSKVLYDVGLSTHAPHIDARPSPYDAHFLEAQTRPDPAFFNARFIHSTSRVLTLYALTRPVLLRAETPYTAQVFDAENYSATSSSFASASLERGVSGGEDLLAVWITNMRTSGSVSEQLFFLLVVRGMEGFRRIGMGVSGSGFGPFRGMGEEARRRVDLV